MRETGNKFAAGLSHDSGGASATTADQLIAARRQIDVSLAVDRPPGIEDFFWCQKVGRLESIAFLGLFCIQLYEFLVSSSLKATGAVARIREVVLEGGEQERSGFTFEPVNSRERPVFHHVEEKTLGQVLGIVRRMPAAPSENVERIPVE